MKKIVCILQTRMGSTRLPGKVMLPLCGKELVCHVMDRILQSKLVPEVVVATTTQKRDDVIVKLFLNYHPRVFVERGSEEDVLDRYYQIAKKRGADIIVRATSDCPFVDPDVIDGVIKTLQEDSTLDYVSNVIGKHTFPRGLDIECFTFAALERCWKEGKEDMDREHVTVYIKRSLAIFATKSYENDVDFSYFRWTIDEEADYRFAEAIYDRIFKRNPRFRMKEVLALLESEPELIAINKHIKHKNPKY